MKEPGELNIEINGNNNNASQTNPIQIPTSLNLSRNNDKEEDTTIIPPSNNEDEDEGSGDSDDEIWAKGNEEKDMGVENDKKDIDSPNSSFNNPTASSTFCGYSSPSESETFATPCPSESEQFTTPCSSPEKGKTKNLKRKLTKEPTKMEIELRERKNTPDYRDKRPYKKNSEKRDQQLIERQLLIQAIEDQSKMIFEISENNKERKETIKTWKK